MSLSVDDLVASFNNNHIGQEAIELAALQAQLSQALFAQSMSSPMAFNSPRNGPVNTPTRTPSASISLDPMEAAWVRSGSTSSVKMRCSIDESQRDGDEMDEDERMVEDLLLSSPASPSSPSASFSRAPQSGAPQTSSSSAYRPRKTSISMHMIPLDHSHHDLPSPNTSLFTTTDPFYLASLQSTHSHPPSTSAFAQAGRPSTHSPFLMHHHMQYGSFGHAFQSVPPDVQPHNMFAATAAAFSM